MAKATKKHKNSSSTEPCLFIVESPTKIKTLSKILDKTQYTPAASVGHCFQLPKKDFVDVAAGYKLNYEIDPKKKDVVKNLLQLAQSCGDTIYYALDADTEGSVIGYHLYSYLKTRVKNKNHVRVNLKEITSSGVSTALSASYPMSDPKEFNIVQAGLLRRIEDRFTGFQLSPLAFIYVQNGTSAGRVQSPALRMVCERQREIDAFVPEVYYDIFADLFPANTKNVFTAKYTGHVKDDKTADAIVASCLGKSVKILNINKKTTKSKSPEPFITKTLLAATSSLFSWKAERTTSIAQSLFQGGHITYIRCDNPVISKEASDNLLSFINSTYPSNFHQKSIPNYNDPKAKLEHECIRPTNLTTTPMFSSSDEAKLYELIRRRFIASGLPAATYDSVSIELQVGAHTFKATGSTLTFEGYLKEWNYNQKDDTTLPSLDMSTSLSLRDCFHERKETKPPARYKDASLIEALDKKGIGKPSTYASILHLLDDRGYLAYDKQSLVPTELGHRLNDFLVKYFDKIVDFDFTARVELAQDDVMQGSRTYEAAVSEFHKHLKESVKEAQSKIQLDRKQDEATTHICPKCNQNYLLKKINRKDGKEFFSCSGYLDKSCTATFSIDEAGAPTEQGKTAEVLSICPRANCNGQLTKRINRKNGEIFYACTNWRQENGNCRVTANASGKVKIPQELKVVKKCTNPKCKGDLVLRTSKAGQSFLGCTKFPQCRKTEPVS